MLAKIRNLWWLVIVCAFLAGVCAYPMVNQVWYAVSSQTYSSKPMYVGRTTLMESLGPPMKDEEHYYQMRMVNLGNLATSSAVLSNVARTLSDLGMEFTPQEVLSGTSVTPVRDTNILAIEVTLPDAKEAKVAADVIAAEMKKEYADRYGSDIRKGIVLKTVDPAFVRPLVRPNPARLLFALLFTPVGGPVIGVIVGLGFGLALAALIRKRQSPIS